MAFEGWRGEAAGPARARFEAEVIGGECHLRVEWPRGADTTALGEVLVGLLSGRYTRSVGEAIRLEGERLGEPAAASSLAEHVRKGLSRAVAGGGIVRPRDATRHLMGQQA